MTPYHNNKLNAVGLFDPIDTYDPLSSSSDMLSPITSGYSGFTDVGLHDYESARSVNHGFAAPAEPEHFVAGLSSNHDQEQERIGLYDREPARPVSYDFDGPVEPEHFIADPSGNHDQEPEYIGLYDHESACPVSYGFDGPIEPERFITGPSGNYEHEQEDEACFRTEHDASSMSYPSTNGSENYESAVEDATQRKPPKMNKDGAPRKPRQPRPKLLRWTDNDWKNALLGIIWACGDNGVEIPFGQAAQLIGESCTASALQQAVLKLRSKQIAEGHRVPALKMAWGRKNKNKEPSTTIADIQAPTKTFTAPMKTLTAPKISMVPMTLPAHKASSDAMKTSTLNHIVRKAKRSLVVRLKVGRHGIKSKKPEAQVLPRNGTQPETPMLSMNGMPHETSMLPNANMFPGTKSMQSGGFTLPINGTPSSMSTAHWVRSQQPLYRNQLPGTQPPLSISTEAQRYNRNHVMVNGFLVDEYDNIKGTVSQPHDISPEAKHYNRNHTVINDFLIDKYNNINATAQDLRPFQNIVTPENSPFHHEYPITQQGQETMFPDNMHDLSDVRHQAHKLPHPPQKRAWASLDV